jgi:asparagine synthetase B (glutamine-hydrolysing)
MVYDGKYTIIAKRDGILKDHFLEPMSDSEVIVHLYEEFATILHKLDGDFAFVVIE